MGEGGGVRGGAVGLASDNSVAAQCRESKNDVADGRIGGVLS